MTKGKDEDQKQTALQIRDSRVFEFMNQLEKAANLPATIQTSVVKMIEKKIQYMLDWEVAEMISSSELVPADYIGKPSNVFLAVQTGRSLGLDEFQSVKHLYTVKGRTSLFGDMMLALVKKHSEYKDIKEEFGELVDVDKTHGNLPKFAKCTIKRNDGLPDITNVYTIEQAMRNPNFNKTTWLTNGQRQMQMRARSFALRDSFPDILSGVYNEYEIEDIKVTKDISDQVEDLGPTSGSDALKDSLKEQDDTTDDQPPVDDIQPEEDKEESVEQKKPEYIERIKFDFKLWVKEKKITRDDYNAFREKGNLGEWDKIVEAHNHFLKKFPPEEKSEEFEEVGEFARKLAIIVDKEEYQPAIGSLITDEDLKHITAKRAEKIFRTTDEKKAKEIFELIEQRKGFFDKEANESR